MNTIRIQKQKKDWVKQTHHTFRCSRIESTLSIAVTIAPITSTT